MFPALPLLSSQRIFSDTFCDSPPRKVRCVVPGYHPPWLLFINPVDPPDVREQALIRESTRRPGHVLKQSPSYGGNARMCRCCRSASVAHESQITRLTMNSCFAGHFVLDLVRGRPLSFIVLTESHELTLFAQMFSRA